MIETVEVVADKGYESREDILNCVINGIVPNVALKYDKHERLFSIEYEEAEITEDVKSSTKPEYIQKCFPFYILNSFCFFTKKQIKPLKIKGFQTNCGGSEGTHSPLLPMVLTKS